MNKNGYHDSYFLSELGSPWTEIRWCNKDIIDEGPWPFPAPEFLLLLCGCTDCTPAVTKLNIFVPTCPLFESGNLWWQQKFVLSLLLTSEFYCKGRKVMLFAWGPSFSLLQHLLPTKERGGFIAKHSKITHMDVRGSSSDTLLFMPPV